MNEYSTDEWICTFSEGITGRGSKVEKLPGGTVWNDNVEIQNRRRGNGGNELQHVNLHQTYEVNFAVDYTVDFSIEDEYMKMISKEMSKSIDEEIMKCLTQGDWDLINSGKEITPEVLWNHICDSPNNQLICNDRNELIASIQSGNQEKQDPKYSDYERAMSIVKEK